MFSRVHRPQATPTRTSDVTYCWHNAKRTGDLSDLYLNVIDSPVGMFSGVGTRKQRLLCGTAVARNALGQLSGGNSNRARHTTRHTPTGAASGKISTQSHSTSGGATDNIVHSRQMHSTCKSLTGINVHSRRMDSTCKSAIENSIHARETQDIVQDQCQDLNSGHVQDFIKIKMDDNFIRTTLDDRANNTTPSYQYNRAQEWKQDQQRLSVSINPKQSDGQDHRQDVYQRHSVRHGRSLPRYMRCCISLPSDISSDDLEMSEPHICTEGKRAQLMNTHLSYDGQQRHVDLHSNEINDNVECHPLHREYS